MYVKIIKSGKIEETYIYEKAPPEHSKAGRKLKTSKEKEREREFRDRYRHINKRTKDNASRTRKNFIRIVRSNFGTDELPALVTLTMRDVVRIDISYKCLSLFFSNLRRYFGKHFRYIAVPEFQKRGAVHFHILVWGFPQEIIEHERKNRTLQNLWSLGYVDCVLTDGSPKLAGYLAKYMSKSVLDSNLGGQKAYTCSRNVLRPVSFNSYSLDSLPQDYWTVERDEVLTIRTFQTKWLGKCTYTCIKNK